MIERTALEMLEDSITRARVDVHVAKLGVLAYKDAGLDTYWADMNLRHAEQSLFDKLEWKRLHTDEWGRYVEDGIE